MNLSHWVWVGVFGCVPRAVFGPPGAVLSEDVCAHGPLNYFFAMY